MVKRGAIILLLILVFSSIYFPLKAADDSKEILLTITERAGLDWKNTPITVGVPIPIGMKKFAFSPRILDQWGREVPSQAFPLGSPTREAAQWWRITFLGTINKNDSLIYRVVPGEERRVLPRLPVEVQPLANGYLLENGRVRLELNERCPLLSKVWLDSNGRASFDEQAPIVEAPMLGVKTDQGIYDHRFSPPAEIFLEEVGPVRAVVNIKGLLLNEERQEGFEYYCRLITYAESPFIRMELRLTNTSSQGVPVEETWVKFDSFKKEESYEIAFGSGGKTPLSAALKKNEFGRVLVDGSGRVQWGGVLAAYSPKQEYTPSALGWADLTGKQWGLSIGIKAFRQQYPKGIQVKGDGEFKVNLIPSSSKIPWESGMAKTHKLTLYFHSKKEREFLKYIEGITNYPPIGVASPDWFNEVGTFNQPLITTKFASALEPELMAMALLLKEKNWSELLNLYGPPDYGAEINPKHWGLFNYGDLRTNFSSPWAQSGDYWNNNAYDLPYQLLVAYLQTGDSSFLEIGEAALTHFKDVDLVNPTANARPFPGLNHIKNPRDGKPHEAEDFRYLGNRGLLLGYYLLDDQLSLDLAMRIADRVCIQDGINLEDPRTLGLSIMAVLTAYQATGREIYFERAEELVETVLKWQQQHDGGLPSDFIYKSGLVLESLVEFYKIRKTPQVLARIKVAVDYAIYHFMDENSGFIQNPGGLLFSNALALLSTETKEQKYREIGLTQLKSFLKNVALNDPKEVALFYRTLTTLMK